MAHRQEAELRGGWSRSSLAPGGEPGLDPAQYEDPRSPAERLSDAAVELQRQREAGEISDEIYTKRMNDLLESAEDFARSQSLEKERIPGEVEEVSETSD